MQQEGTGVEFLVGYRLKQAQSALRSRMDQALRPLGLTTPQYSCLEMLSQNPGASNAEIARSVFVTRQTMNTLLRGLQERGLVRRAVRAETGRAIPTTLTDDGRSLLAEASECVGRVNRAMTDSLGSDLAEALAFGLSRCVEALEAMPDVHNE